MIKLSPIDKYKQDLKKDDFLFDAAQENAVKHLQRLYEDLQTKPVEISSFKKVLNSWKKVYKKQDDKPIKGLYFWGGVGRGKTYLVDTFYDCLPFENKMRVHFHRFMHRVHQELKALTGQSDPLKIIAKKFAKETRIICFDEFFVSDITDAMILGSLFEELFAHNVILVATSNIVPDELYRNGLQRERFLPAIKLINENTEIVNVDSGVDYRLRTLEQAEIYHYPLDQKATDNLHYYFKQLSSDAIKSGVDIEINNRQLPTVLVSDGIVYFDFSVLCESARSQGDYMKISQEYHTVLMANVKQMGRESDDSTRRFIALVDEFYERNVKLIMSAEMPLEELYSGGNLAFEFKRCLSRLQEMQSHDYLASEHLP
ncbi:cell division protein ZapE [Colwellia sp. 4_MG-2023]|jgi:cell division protein ZapE|uniref:cell division protein ZapE n=1 Tax=unclassified Colwellia TaxID=196834 RepID=UPI001C086CCC|nr:MULTISPECIES: cell division protein ZapE [unclassified Colwellia]MBU2926257.1 AFG1 family ATPase [Colwellia sp. C2M11]MDO6489432.1 cell division protein ZapE [Colwellia sp. 6_MG-2023]MDO6508504.1 cell division protein ZapE [Colwellia sp. 5_MG-2023]MDO6557119.1 cell division protein ZapE [Colwellia sp. 4_MG-2023]MDO6652321.1 cell division protein ZapE [Colwellia sp. 3_MG-2023]